MAWAAPPLMIAAMKRVVVTGIGIVSPLGLSAADHWAALLAGKSGVGPITRFDPGGFDCRIAGQVPDYRMADHVPKAYRKATKVMARDSELAVIAADDAFRDAGLRSKAYTDAPEIDGTRFGCNIGAGLISADLDELTAAMDAARSDADPTRLDLRKWGTEGLANLTPLWLLKYLPNMLACHVTIVHGLMGPSNTITCGDASGHLAIGEAFRAIQRGKADLAVCGGAESKLNPMGLIRQEKLGRLNGTSNDAPGEAVRPFDEAAKGTVVGEGGGLLILEEMEHATARGATIYAELAGFAASQDTYKITEPDPTGRSYANAVRNALKDAGATPADVGAIVPHGLGIASHDRAELAGLRLAFGDRLSKIPAAATKAATGNLSAGSAADAATAALALRHGTLPPTLNAPADPPLGLSREPRPVDAGVAVATVYSLGGQNAALVFRRVDD